jgi:BolA protein
VKPAGASTEARIRERLDALDPETVDIRDDSHQHVGHEGAKGGGGHYRVVIVSRRFSGVPVQRRHRMVYDALGTMMQQDIHALAIVARAPEEVDALQREENKE